MADDSGAWSPRPYNPASVSLTPHRRTGRFDVPTASGADGKSEVRLSRRRLLVGSCAIAARASMVPRLSAQAADIRVLSSSNMRPILAELTALFERTTRRRWSVMIVEAVPVRDRILAGELADVAITQRPLLDDLLANGRLVPGSVVDVARSTVSMVVRAGGPQPDISSVNAFQRSLLSSTSIAYPDPKAGGLAGIYFLRALERLGIAEQMQGKTTLAASGQEACRLVASGTVELGVAQTSTARAAAGVVAIGALPKELGVDIVVSAGIVAGTRELDASRELLTFLTSPAVAAIIRAGGMEPQADARFLINRVLDSAPAPITLIQNWMPEAQKQSPPR